MSYRTALIAIVHGVAGLGAAQAHGTYSARPVVIYSSAHVVPAPGTQIDPQSLEVTGIDLDHPFRFAKALFRHLPAIRRAIKGEAATVEVERFEFAPLARMLGCPLIVMVHNEGDPKTDKMDSVLSRH